MKPERIAAIPKEMKDRHQWVAWSLVHRAGKPTKLPIDPKTGYTAKSDDPKTWGTFEQALHAGAALSGIGYVFSAEDPFCGIDMDGHVDQDLIDWMDSYAERSQSGQGAHIIVRASIADGKGRKCKTHEVYDRLRYFVVTGDVIHNRPIAEATDKVAEFIAATFPESQSTDDEDAGPDLSRFLSQPRYNLPSDSELLARIRESSQADKFEGLWSGNWRSLGYESQSSADAALLAILRFWTRADKGQAFRLFEASGLSRDKWRNRSDYRERTWASVDNGPVYEDPIASRMASMAPVISAQIVARNTAPWRAVTIDRALEAVAGSVLEPMIRAFRSPMDPPLPAEIGLVKAIALAGCALSEKRKEPRENGNLAAYTMKGADLARVRIMTAGGQVPNMLAMIVAESAVGKDIGGLLEKVANEYQWMIGTAGSEEGLADAYIQKPNGLLQISEFSNWLDKNHWQSKAAGFITHAFNKGWFVHTMSRRSDAPSRETNFCYPNIYASIQPGAMQAFASKIDLETGFLGRFLIAAMPSGYFGCPVVGNLQDDLAEAKTAVETLRAKDCDVIPPHGYNRDLARVFLDNAAEPGPTWRRLVNEYYPRFATILSIAPRDYGAEIHLTADAWDRAAVLVQYFFGQAEAVLTDIHDDRETNAFESLCSRVLAHIRARGKAGATLTTITNSFSRGTRSQQRKEVIGELLARGLVREDKGTAFSTYYDATLGT